MCRCFLFFSCYEWLEAGRHHIFVYIIRTFELYQCVVVPLIPSCLMLIVSGCWCHLSQVLLKKCETFAVEFRVRFHFILKGDLPARVVTLNALPLDWIRKITRDVHDGDNRNHRSWYWWGLYQHQLIILQLNVMILHIQNTAILFLLLDATHMSLYGKIYTILRYTHIHRQWNWP